MLSEPHDQLHWDAFRYVAGEMTGDERFAFEEQLLAHQAAREAVALAAELTQLVEVACWEEDASAQAAVTSPAPGSHVATCPTGGHVPGEVIAQGVSGGTSLGSAAQAGAGPATNSSAAGAPVATSSPAASLAAPAVATALSQGAAAAAVSPPQYRRRFAARRVVVGLVMGSAAVVMALALLPALNQRFWPAPLGGGPGGAGGQHALGDPSSEKLPGELALAWASSQFDLRAATGIAEEGAAEEPAPDGPRNDDTARTDDSTAEDGLLCAGESGEVTIPDWLLAAVSSAHATNDQPEK